MKLKSWIQIHLYIKKIISDVAREEGIPPEILKAIAAIESKFKQNDASGDPVISPDGGIGIMQVTPGKVDIPLDSSRLKTDITYNIEIAAKILKKKKKLDYLPELNDGNNQVLENWYFAVMAYNGLSKSNDPAINSGETYQEDIYERISNAALIGYVPFDFPSFDIRYEDGSDIMSFPPDKHYETSTTLSQQMYNSGDVVYLDKRDGPVTIHKGSIYGDGPRLLPYTPLTVTGEPVESPYKDNDFTYYPVKGVDVEGYISSAYLNQGSEDLLFNDPYTDERAAALAFASMNDYVNGLPSGNFGSLDSIKREHVAVILDRILDLSAPESYQMEADDVKKDHPYYEQLKASEYYGYLGATGELRPKEFLTRAQMAEVMIRAFNSYYQEPTKNHQFEDQDKIWNPENVNKIYYNNATIVDPFRPEEKITRSQFALFIYRTMVDY